MTQKIAILSDIHGNCTALEAVLKDAKKQGVHDYWLLGDLIMHGPASSELFKIVKDLQPSVFVKGNWEDCFLSVLKKEADLDNPSDVYVARLTQHLYERMSSEEVEFVKNLPLNQMTDLNHLKISVSHNLPDKNYGGVLLPTESQENFDELFISDDIDIAIYGHVHHQLLRYSSKEQLIINPGSIGCPFMAWSNLRRETRAQYAILEIDESGMVQVNFRQIPYDLLKELQRAKNADLPYIELYEDMLASGSSYTHDKSTLSKINEANGYRGDVESFLGSV